MSLSLNFLKPRRITNCGFELKLSGHFPGRSPLWIMDKFYFFVKISNIAVFEPCHGFKSSPELQIQQPRLWQACHESLTGPASGKGPAARGGTHDPIIRLTCQVGQVTPAVKPAVSLSGNSQSDHSLSHGGPTRRHSARARLRRRPAHGSHGRRSRWT